MLAAALNALAGLVLAVNGQTYDGGGATVNYLSVTGSNITVTNLRISDSGPGINAVTVRGNYNTLRGIVVERAGAAGVYFMSGTGHVLEDSTIRDPVRRVRRDSWGIYSAAAGKVTVRRNTVHGSGFSTYAPGGSSLIEDNTFVVPAGYRTDCNGNAEPGGPCQCAEFGVALKSGNSIIRRNWISGYRTADPICGGSGAPGAGIAVAACAPFQQCPTGHVQITGNTIRDSHDGVYVSPRSADILIEGNRICGSDVAISDGFGAPSRILGNEFLGNEVDLNLYGSRFGMVSGNGASSESCATQPPAPGTIAPPTAGSYSAPPPAPAPTTDAAPPPAAREARPRRHLFARAGRTPFARYQHSRRR